LSLLITKLELNGYSSSRESMVSNFGKSSESL
jgi:hypothetical protein